MGGFAKKASQAGSKAVLRKQSAKKWHKRPAAYAASSPTTTTAPRRVIRNHGTPDDPKRDKTEVI
ncbi:hypothetical protein AA0121_g11272 [Alternaria tenuissima]|nr:hypothetical protein AA0121_g11272 [Alternaria tenuissima]